jgi:hypothetical protein
MSGHWCLQQTSINQHNNKQHRNKQHWQHKLGLNVVPNYYCFILYLQSFVSLWWWLVTGRTYTLWKEELASITLKFSTPHRSNHHCYNTVE